MVTAMVAAPVRVSPDLAAYARLHADLTAAGYKPGDPTAEIAADARTAFPDSLVVFFGRWLFGWKLISFRGFVITDDGCVMEF